MEGLDLYRFLHEHDIAMRWDDEQLSTWVSHWHLEDFAKLIGSSLEEGGRNAHLCSDGSIWIDLVPICEYYGIEPEKIFPKT
jgi:hypothetical protein